MTTPPSPAPNNGPPPLTIRQSLLWLTAGMVSTFLLVSAVFAIKLGIDGKALSAGTSPRPASPLAATPKSDGNSPAPRMASPSTQR